MSVNNDTIYQNFLTCLRQHLTIVEVQGQKYIGYEIISTPDEITISHATYIKDKLNYFGLTDANTVKTISATLRPLNECLDSTPIDRTTYLEMLGSLLFIGIHTRPDIIYTVVQLARHSTSPKQAHYTALKRVWRYLKNTINWKLHFSKTTISDLQGFSDASWDSTPHSRGVSGILLSLGSASILWSSKTQPLVAHSSCEAETSAMCQLVKHLIPIRGLLSELHRALLKYPITVYTDSRSAIDLLINGGSSQSRHYTRKIQYVQDEVKLKNILVTFTPSTDMPADALTKHLTSSKVIYFMKEFFGLY